MKRAILLSRYHGGNCALCKMSTTDGETANFTATAIPYRLFFMSTICHDCAKAIAKAWAAEKKVRKL